MTSEIKNDQRSIDVTVNNRYGLHIRCCNEILRLAQNFDSVITLTNNRRKADAKSILNLMTLAAGQGAQLKVTASGHDADAAIEAFREYFSREIVE